MVHRGATTAPPIDAPLLSHLPDAFRPFVPFPFYEIQLPVSDRTLSDSLGPLLRQCRGLAECLGAAVRDQGDSSDLFAALYTAEVLAGYLYIAERLFDTWNEARRGEVRP